MHPTRIFKEPKELQQAWEEYKEHLKVEALQWVKIQYVGKEGQRMEDAFKLPYTFDGFSVFCYNKYGTVKHYFDNKENYYTDFGVICSHIKEEIRANQITGGLLGIYNPSITQRLNSLVEKVQTDVSIDVPIIDMSKWK
jgi:hypothetical protein